MDEAALQAAVPERLGPSEIERARHDERGLVARAAAGDATAFRALVAAHEAAVATIVTAMVGAGDDADDVGQETFVRLLRALPTFRFDASVRTYVTRIAMNASLDLLARRKRRAGWLRLTGRAGDATLQLPATGDDASARVEREEQLHQLQRAIATLDDKHRAVLVARMLDERSTREVADMLGIPEGTVMSRLTRAMAKLRSALDARTDGGRRA